MLRRGLQTLDKLDKVEKAKQEEEEAKQATVSSRPQISKEAKVSF